MFAERDLHYPSSSGQTRLATAVTNFTKPVTKNICGPSREQLFIGAIISQVIIYEITRLKSRHKRLREVLLPAQAQCLNVFSEGRLCVGYQSGFTIYSLMGDQHPLCE